MLRKEPASGRFELCYLWADHLLGGGSWVPAKESAIVVTRSSLLPLFEGRCQPCCSPCRLVTLLPFFSPADTGLSSTGIALIVAAVLLASCIAVAAAVKCKR